MSVCLLTDENLNLGTDFQMFVLLTTYYRALLYYFNLFFISRMLFEIIVFISLLRVFMLYINYVQVIYKLNSFYLSLLGIMATSFFIYAFNQSVVVAFDIKENAVYTYNLGSEFFSLTCQQIDLQYPCRDFYI